MNKPADLLQDNREFDQDIFDDLNKNGFSDDETDLIRALNESKNASEIRRAVIALGYNGSNKSLGVLKPLLDHKNEDVRSTTVLSIAKISGASSTSLFAKLLTQDFEPKVYPMAALWKVGDSSAINEVRIFADGLLAGKAKFIDWSNDPLYVIEYLKNHSNDKEDINRYENLQDLYDQKNKSVGRVLKNLFRKK